MEEYKWSMEWQKNASRLHTFIEDVSPMSPAFSFPRPAWVKLNRLRSGVGIFLTKTHKWGAAFMAACECGAKEQTAKHIITSCPVYHHLNRAHAFLDVKKNLVTWLMETCPGIQWTIQLSSISPKRRKRFTIFWIRHKFRN